MKQVLLLLLLLAALPARAQSPVLDAYLREGQANNLALRQKQLDVRKNIEAVRQAKSLFYPTVRFQASYTRAAGGRRIDFPIGDLLNPVYATLNQLTQSQQFPTLENQQINFLPDNFQETKVSVSYPLFNAGLRYNRAIREQLLAGAEATSEAYGAELRYTLTEAYLRYLQSLEAEKIYNSARTVLTELKRFNQSLVDNQVATREVVSTAEYELSKVEGNLADLHADQNTARAYFNFLLNRDLQSAVDVDTALLRATVTPYNLDDLLQNARTRRREFRALDAGLQASETARQLRAADLRLPDAYIGAEGGFQGFGYKFNGEQSYVLAQVGITYDLFTGGARNSKLQEARIDFEKLQAQYAEADRQIALQITQSWNELEAARQQWQTARTGLQAAEASFKIVNNRYKAQQALLLEFLDAQNRVTQARLQILIDWTDVLAREAALKKAAGL